MPISQTSSSPRPCLLGDASDLGGISINNFAVKDQENAMKLTRIFLFTALFLTFARFIDAASLSTPALLSPVNGEVGTVTGPILDWADVTGATNYRVFVHENKSVLQAITPSQITCSQCRVNAVTYSSMFKFSYSDPLAPGRQYYWMVRAGNSSTGSVSQNSQIWGFKTGDQPVVVSYYDGGFLGLDYYIVKVRLDSGARVEPYLGAVQSGSATNCLGSGYNYFQFGARNVAGFISSSTEIASARVVISGSFHDGNSNEGYLHPAFPQKIRGKIETFGKDCVNNYQGSLRMLEIRPSESRAFIEPFDLTKFKSTTIAPNVIVGLHPDYDKSASYPVGRNFACVKDGSGGGYKTIIFVVTDGMKSASAKSVLTGQGCDASLMIQLDGSTVSQLSEKVGSIWQHRITASRTMPQIFAIFNPN
jgi:hypothetical protein